eukprot:XP_011445362.1 PREDICTED: uncharacterized protein LOC105340837 isoform X1 [Crassostrea gigas]
MVEMVIITCLMLFYLPGVKSLNIQKTFQEDALVISWKSQLDKTQIDKEYVRYSSSVGLLKSWAVSRNSEIQIQDAINHDSVRLQIMQRYTNFSLAYFSFDIKTNKRFFREGETGTVSWTMTRYSENERYSIFHKNETIFKVSKQNASSFYPDKYVYQETPSDPRRVGFQIINVSLPDSGVYTGGSLRPLAEDWAYVIVYGNPLKPKIIGQTKVDVGNYVTLKCLSVSTSLPNNYKRYPSITYKWFKNGNFIIRSGNILRLKVEEELYKDKITCQAKEVVSSTLSDSVQIEKPNCSEKIKSKFIAGNAEFSWSSVGDSEQSIFVTRNDDPGNWSDANQPYTVKDALNFSSIEVDVKILDSMKKEIFLCRGLFSGPNKPDILKSQEGRNATITWTIPFFPSAGSYYIFRNTNTLEKTILTITRNGNTSGQSEKYQYKRIPNKSSSQILLEVKNISLQDGDLYRGGTSLSDAQNTRGVLLVVAGKPSTPIIESNLETPRYGNTLTLTCRSYSTSQPAYYRHQLTWSYTWYRNDSIVYRGHTYAFTVSRDVVYDEIMCQAKEVILSKNSSTYKIGYLEKSRPAEPKIVGISQTNAKYLRITWSSPFDGGYPQYFLIYQQTITVWDVVANISQSNATIQSADVPSGPKGVYGVAIMSCNMLGCTMPVKLDRESNAFLNDNGNSAGIAIGSSLAVIVLAIMVLLGLLHMKYGIGHTLKKKILRRS